MLEAVIAILGAIVGLFIYRTVGKVQVDAEQQALEIKVKEIRKKDEDQVENLKKIEANEKTKVEEITNEQNKDQSTSDLVDFFRNNKGGR